MNFYLLKNSEIEELVEAGLDTEVLGQKIKVDNTFVKNCTDLTIYNYIIQNVEPGSKLLEIGGGNSRLLPLLKDKYECWNLDKFEGAGNGPVKIEEAQSGTKIVKAFIGEFSDELRNNYFDFIFSNSVLEHLPKKDNQLYKNIYFDIYRLLNSKGRCLHCIDVFFVQGNKYRYHPVIDFYSKRFFKGPGFNMLLNHYNIKKGGDSVFFMSEEIYNKRWKRSTKRTYDEMGHPTSVQIEYSKKDLIAKKLNYKQDDKIITYVHIAKAGGSTFIDILKQIYTEEDVIHVWPNGRFKSVVQLSRNKRLKYKVILGHFNYGIHKLIHKKLQYITILREPINRLISSYFYSLKNEDHKLHKHLKENKTTLEEYLLTPLTKDIDNGQIRMLLNSRNPIGKIGKAQLETAKKNLDQHFIFGILERWEDSINHFKKELQWLEIPKYEIKNASGKKEYSLTDDVIQQVREQNKYDIELYEYAIELFNKRVNDK